MKEENFRGSLSALRSRISKLDRELLALFKRRMQAIEEVAEHKKNTGQAVLDRQREAEILAGLDGCKRIFLETLLRLSRERQYDLLMDLDSNWRLGQELRDGAGQLPPVRTIAVAHGDDGGIMSAASRLFPNTQAVPSGCSAAAVKMAAEQRADLALLPLTNRSQVFTLLAQNGLYIQSAFRLGERIRYLAAGSALTLPTEGGQLSLLLQTGGDLTALAPAWHMFLDLGIKLAAIESLARGSEGINLHLALWATPENRTMRQALYQLEHEFPEFSLLGWYEVKTVLAAD